MAVFTIPASNRSSGTFIEPSSGGGAEIPSNASFALVQYSIPQLSDRLDTNARMDFAIEVSTNNGATWKDYLNAGWTGGSTAVGKNSTVVNPPPTAGFGGDFFQAFGGQRIQIKTFTATAMRIGMTITVST